MADWLSSSCPLKIVSYSFAIARNFFSTVRFLSLSLFFLTGCHLLTCGFIVKLNVHVLFASFLIRIQIRRVILTPEPPAMEESTQSKRKVDVDRQISPEVFFYRTFHFEDEGFYSAVN